MSAKRHRIAVIPGDGIGQEVIPAALTVLEAVASRSGFTFDLVEFPYGCAYYAKHGRMMAADAFERQAMAEQHVVTGRQAGGKRLATRRVLPGEVPVVGDDERLVHARRRSSGKGSNLCDAAGNRKAEAMVCQAETGTVGCDAGK